MTACAWCGAELDIDWVDVGTLGNPDREPIPGRVTCPTPGCVPRCPICRGVVDDIHGPECGPIILAKLGDLTPCTITRADCGQREQPIPVPRHAQRVNLLVNSSYAYDHRSNTSLS